MSDASTAELLMQVMERLDRMEQRLDAITATTEKLGAVADKAPVMIEAVASTAQFAFNEAEANGIDPIKGGLSALELGLMAAQPASMATVKRLLAQTVLLGKTLDTVEKLDQDGTLAILMQNGEELAPRLAKLMASPTFTALTAQALDDPKVMETASAATTALVETRVAGWSPAGLFSPLTALFDKDIAKTIGFTLAVAKRFGQKL